LTKKTGYIIDSLAKKLEAAMVNERLASLAFLLVGAYGFIFSVQLPVGKWREPGPGVFPLALSILLCFFGVLWFIRGKGKRRETSVDRLEAIGKLSAPLKIVAATAALVIAWDRLGYLLTSSLYMFLLFFWVSRHKCVIAVELAIAIGVGSWLFFDKLLAVQLPAGLLPF
jgi:putative tricarboxylic transport membrane protein